MGGGGGGGVLLFCRFVYLLLSLLIRKMSLKVKHGVEADMANKSGEYPLF